MNLRELINKIPEEFDLDSVSYNDDMNSFKVVIDVPDDRVSTVTIKEGEQTMAYRVYSLITCYFDFRDDKLFDYSFDVEHYDCSDHYTYIDIKDLKVISKLINELGGEKFWKQ